MTAGKAIKSLEKHKELILVAFNPELNKAVKLGIEALRFFQDLRNRGALPPGTRLPGETKE
jgi:hypothetical protein